MMLLLPSFESAAGGEDQIRETRIYWSLASTEHIHRDTYKDHSYRTYQSSGMLRMGELPKTTEGSRVRRTDFR